METFYFEGTDYYIIASDQPFASSKKEIKKTKKYEYVKKDKCRFKNCRKKPILNKNGMPLYCGKHVSNY
jgi:hypothetical protein